MEKRDEQDLHKIKLKHLRHKNVFYTERNIYLKKLM